MLRVKACTWPVLLLPACCASILTAYGAAAQLPGHNRTVSAGALEALQRGGARDGPGPAASEVSLGEESDLQKATSADMDSLATLQRIAEALGEVDQDDLSEAGLLVVGPCTRFSLC